VTWCGFTAPQAPKVLSVVLAHSDPSLLPLLGDIVQDVLLALDLSYDHTAVLFCSVLRSLMKALGEALLTGGLRSGRSSGFDFPMSTVRHPSLSKMP